MTTLVTGATGFVGSHVARQLVAAGHSVRVLVRPNSNLQLLEGLAVRSVSKAILRDAASLGRAMKGVRRGFSCGRRLSLWARNPEEIYESNVRGHAAVVRSGRACEGVERVVYTSTVATIAVPHAWRTRFPTKKRERTLDEMIGHYKRSKFLAEQEAMKAAAAGLPVVIVNPTTPVGPGDWKPTPTGRIIVDFLNGNMPAYVDTGLNLVAVEDVAAGHLLAAERGRIGERYILGGRNMTLKQILDALSRDYGRPAPRVQLAARGGAWPPATRTSWFSRLARARAANSGGRRENVAASRCLWQATRREGNWAISPGRWKRRWSARCAGMKHHGYVAGARGGKAVAHRAGSLGVATNENSGHIRARKRIRTVACAAEVSPAR